VLDAVDYLIEKVATSSSATKNATFEKPNLCKSIFIIIKSSCVIIYLRMTVALTGYANAADFKIGEVENCTKVEFPPSDEQTSSNVQQAHIDVDCPSGRFQKLS